MNGKLKLFRILLFFITIFVRFIGPCPKKTETVKTKHK